MNEILVTYLNDFGVLALLAFNSKRVRCKIEKYKSCEEIKCKI